MSALKLQVRELLEKEFPPSTAGPLKDSDPLLELGVIDSLGVVKLIDLLQNRFSFKIPRADVRMKSFESIEAIAEMMKRNGAAPRPK